MNKTIKMTNKEKLEKLSQVARNNLFTALQAGQPLITEIDKESKTITFSAKYIVKDVPKADLVAFEKSIAKKIKEFNKYQNDILTYPIIDIRGKREVEKKPSIFENIPMKDILGNYKEHFEKGKNYTLVCASGTRASQVIKELNENEEFKKDKITLHNGGEVSFIEKRYKEVNKNED